VAKKHIAQNGITMTAAEFLDRMVELRNEWSEATKSETNQTKLFQAGESFIDGMEAALILATPSGAHPPPPQPRIRP
jgi:hypothetical protein